MEYAADTQLVAQCKDTTDAMEGSPVMTCVDGAWDQPMPWCSKTSDRQHFDGTQFGNHQRPFNTVQFRISPSSCAIQSEWRSLAGGAAGRAGGAARCPGAAGLCLQQGERNTCVELEQH